jgi:putrescine transport system permease protein
MKRLGLPRLDLARIPGSRWAIIVSPYVWMLLFFLLPFVIVLRISVAEAQFSIPPFSALFQWAADRLTIEINFSNYQWLFADNTYLRAYGQSLRIAFFSTLFCMFLGFPIAYTIARAPAGLQPTLLLLILLPSWTSFLIRVYAWMGLLGNRGLINQGLVALGIVDTPIQMLNTPFAVYIGIVYAYLPFMILPLYANLVKHDQTLLEAASDLGARQLTTFYRITLPLAKNGLIAGSMLVFIPVVGEYVIPELLGGRQTLMIGKVLWQEFFNNRDWPMAGALAFVMILILLIPILVFMRVQRKEFER